jgi:hypothetical protein
MFGTLLTHRLRATMLAATAVLLSAGCTKRSAQTSTTTVAGSGLSDAAGAGAGSAPPDGGSVLGPPDAAVESSNASPAGSDSGAGSSDARAQSLDCSAESVDWPMFGQNVCNTASQATAGAISPDTVGGLTIKWVFSASADVSTPSRPPATACAMRRPFSARRGDVDTS